MRIPGFVDLQVNGYMGVDFSSPELTAFMPTVITSPKELYRRNLPIISGVIDSEEFYGRVLGIHLEGPFISEKPGAVGAHNPDWTTDPDIEYFDQIQEYANGQIKLMTIAAERTKAAEFTKELADRHVAVSLGHQMADYEDMKQLYEAGAKSVTHFANGVPNQINRHINPITAALVVL